jgi:hypothetical protein
MNPNWMADIWQDLLGLAIVLGIVLAYYCKARGKTFKEVAEEFKEAIQRLKGEEEND